MVGRHFGKLTGDLAEQLLSVAHSLNVYLSNVDTELPPQGSIEDAVDAMLRLYEVSGGSTFSLYFGSQAGQRLYAVSLYPERTVIIPGRAIPKEVLRTFIEANDDFLRDSCCCV